MPADKRRSLTVIDYIRVVIPFHLFTGGLLILFIVIFIRAIIHQKWGWLALSVFGLCFAIPGEYWAIRSIIRFYRRQRPESSDSLDPDNDDTR